MKRFALALWFACCAATAQPLALPPPPQARLDEHIGAHVPLDVAVTDDTGRREQLSDLVDGTKPVLLVPGYYRCPQLCGLVMHGLLDALQASGAARNHWRIVGISLDPRERAVDARTRRDMDLAYASSLPGGAGAQAAIDLRLLTLQPAELARVTAAIGDRFDIASGESAQAIAHPATVVLLTPRGKVAGYFNGVGIEPGELRVALADAAGDRLRAVSARVALLCAHFDPHVGRLSGAVMSGLRVGSAVLVIALAGWCWRRRGGRAAGSP
jgi:protein SCO1/2